MTSYSPIDREAFKQFNRNRFSRVAELKHQFHGLAEKTDTEIWEFVSTNDFCLVTQDADFAERSRLYGSLPKVVWLRCGNAPSNQVEALIRSGCYANESMIQMELVTAM